MLVIRIITRIITIVFCSDQLKRHYNLGQYWLEVDIEDLTHFDASLSDKLLTQPTEHLPLVSIHFFYLVFLDCYIIL